MFHVCQSITPNSKSMLRALIGIYHYSNVYFAGPYSIKGLLYRPQLKKKREVNCSFFLILNLSRSYIYNIHQGDLS